MHPSPRSLPSILLAAVAAVLLLAAGPATAATKYPSVSSVSPKKLGIGDTLVIKGQNFRTGKKKTTVVFKRDGGRAIFVKADQATKTKLTLRVPAKLLPYLKQKAGKPIATRFRVRILTTRFGKKYTTVKMSPVISASASASGNPDDCDGDGVLNSKDTDDDGDLLSDAEEAAWGLQSCKADTDGDGLSDGWEQISAMDRNGKAVPAPKRKPFPNALDATDGKAVDHDGDGLSNLEEYIAWKTYSGVLRPADTNPYTSRLTYSGGNPTSDGRAQVSADLWYMDRDNNGYLSDFERDADGDRIPNMDEMRAEYNGGRGGDPDYAQDPRVIDFGLFTEIYLVKYAEEQSKQDGPRCAGINQIPFYCNDSAQPPFAAIEKVDQLDYVEADTDGDGIRDDEDDVDHDDIANFAEYLDELRAIPQGDRRFRHLDACVPSSDSRFCLIGSVDVDRDGIPNRDDTDDDGDLLADALERDIKTDALIADTDGDLVSDGFEYLSALDLNSLALPYPGKRPYPNALDGEDGDHDYDQDVLTLREEYKAWRKTGSPLPLSYSDGTQWTGGKLEPTGTLAGLDWNGDGTVSDDEKDVDGDGLNNYTETHGPLSGPEWWDQWTLGRCGQEYFESRYPGPAYLGLNFVDPDTDGDGLADGPDDVDHDGFSNADEAFRPGTWCTTYISIGHPGTDRYARVQPFNPCKPINSAVCHRYPPFGYYKDEEDWASPYSE